jgi:hypothetical protein
MKKVFLLFFLFVFISANAQFKATKDGLTTEDGKPYYVVPIEGKTAMELYKGVNSYVLSNYKNPDAVANKMEGEMINIHSFDNEAFLLSKVMGMSVYGEIDMNLVVYFKDNRIRFDIPVINKMQADKTSGVGKDKTQYHFSGGIGKFMGSASLFNDKGKVKDKKFVEGLESYVNNMIKEISESAKSYSEEDW